MGNTYEIKKDDFFVLKELSKCVNAFREPLSVIFKLKIESKWFRIAFRQLERESIL